MRAIVGRAKTQYKIGALQRDRSYIQSIKPFSQNVEIKTVKTYASAADPSGNPLTFELNNSLVLLPKVPMKPRYADARVGFFGTGYVDFDTDPQGVTKTTMITRWRLEPKPEDMEIPSKKVGIITPPSRMNTIEIDLGTGDPPRWLSPAPTFPKNRNLRSPTFPEKTEISLHGNRLIC